MTDNRKVLIFLGDKLCPACEAFKPTWEKLCNNNLIRSYFYIYSFDGRGNVGRVSKDETVLLLPKAFNRFIRLPTLLIISAEEFAKRWNLEGYTNSRVQNADEVITNAVSISEEMLKREIVDGVMRVVPNTEFIVSWILRNANVPKNP